MTTSTLTLALDRERELRLDFNALGKFEQVSGRSALDPATWSSPRAFDIAALVWAAQTAAAEAPYLIAGRMPPEDLDVLTFGQVRVMLDPSRLADVQSVLARVWELFFPTVTDSAPAPAEEDGADAPRPPTS